MSEQLNKKLQVEMLKASGTMRLMELFDGKSKDYIEAFRAGMNFASDEFLKIVEIYLKNLHDE